MTIDEGNARARQRQRRRQRRDSFRLDQRRARIRRRRQPRQPDHRLRRRGRDRLLDGQVCGGRPCGRQRRERRDRNLGGLDRRHVQRERNLYVGQLQRRHGRVRRRSRDLRRHGRERRLGTFSDGTARRLRSRHRRRPATPLPSTPGPRSARAPGLIPAASTSTMTETRAARATSGASALAQTARSVTGLGLARNARQLGFAR